jgi:MFS family permease
MTQRAPSALALACVLTFLHYTGTFMRVPVLPLYARAHGATPVEIGVIVGAHMVLSALSAIPFGYASDRWGRRAFLIGGMGISAVTSFLLPLVGAPAALMVIYGVAGLGPAAFTPSVMSLVGDVAEPGMIGRAYAWYTTALYAGFGVGPILGGYVAAFWGEGVAFVLAGGIIAGATVLGAALPRVETRGARQAASRAFTELRGNRRVWAGWIATVSGLAPWGAIITFFPLLARDRGLGPSEIGLFFGVQAFVNTATRVPAGWLLDRTRARRRYVVGGLLLAALGTALVPSVHAGSHYILLAAGLGAAIAVPFVAIGAALAEATTPATRGLAMGGYSTAIFLSFALASFGLGPVVAIWGLGAGFVVAGLAGAAGTLVAALLWGAPARRPS